MHKHFKSCSLPYTHILTIAVFEIQEYEKLFQILQNMKKIKIFVFVFTFKNSHKILQERLYIFALGCI